TDSTKLVGSNKQILEVCRRIRLCGSRCDLCVAVVSGFPSNFTTETQRLTETTRRNPFSNRLLVKIISFTHDDDHERTGFHCARRSSAGLGWRPLGVFSRGQEYFFRLWIEGHRLRARLRLDGAGILVNVRRLLAVDAQVSISTREKDQMRVGIKTSVVHARANRKAVNDLSARGIHNYHFRFVPAADE